MTTRHRPSSTDLYLDRSSANETTVTVGPITLHYSYSTVVAFRAPGVGFVVSENTWSNTTGRHLTNIDGGGAAKKNRTPHHEFERLLAETLDRLHIAFEE